MIATLGLCVCFGKELYPSLDERWGTGHYPISSLFDREGHWYFLFETSNC